MIVTYSCKPADNYVEYESTMDAPPHLTDISLALDLATRLRKLDTRIKPMQIDAEGRLSWVIDYDPFGTAFNFCDGTRLEPVDRPLSVLGSLTTNHTFAYQGLVKPTAAEVLMQLPEPLLKIAVGYSIDPEKETQIHRGQDNSHPECSEWHRVPLLVYGAGETISPRGKPETAEEILYPLS